ncbi:MAG: TIGR02099 family protein [Burkholderiales bacterium]|nr:TIGR02099 family protein [Burkholderiales bacterium]
MNDLQPPPKLPHGPGGALARVEDAVDRVEQALEDTVHAAERSLARRFGSGCVRALRLIVRIVFIALVLAYFIFGAVFLATRYLLTPRLYEVRPWLERQASLRLRTEVTIDTMDAEWRGVHPVLRLTNVQIRDRAGQVQLTLPKVEAVPGWSSLPRLSLRFASLSVLAPELEVERLAAQRFRIAGFVVEPTAGASTDSAALDWVLSQESIVVRDARVTYVDRTHAQAGKPPTTQAFTDLQFAYRNRLARHQFALSARAPAALAGQVDVRGDFQQGLFERASNFAEWSGQLYASVDYADVAALDALTRLLPPSVRVDAAQGAVRLWATIERRRLERLTADVALTNVNAQLGEGLEPLRLSSVQGRITQREWGTLRRGGQELELVGLALQGVGKEAKVLAVPRTDVKLRWTRPQEAGAGDERTEIEASEFTLESLSTLAQHLPLPANVHELVGRHAARGTLSQLKAAVDGPLAKPQRYRARTRFDGLAAQGQEAQRLPDGRPRPRLQGFENLSGTLEINESGGSVALASRDVSIDAPGLLDEPRVTLAKLTGQVRWTLRPQLQVQFDNLIVANGDLELNGAGSWRTGGKGAGLIDVNLRVPRVQLAAVPRYVPLTASSAARSWLEHALVGGQGRDGALRLRGDLKDFPFTDAAGGEFRVAFKVRDAVLDYQSAAMPTADGSVRAAWPRVEDIDADLVIDRRRLAVTGSGRIFGTRLTRANARIPDLFSKDMHLLIEGVTNGPLADIPRYMAATPLNARLGNLFSTTTASGNARLDLKLDSPLTHASDTLVAGSVVLSNNDLALRADIPALTRASGRVEFTERTLRIVNVSANALGGMARIDGSTLPDGAIVINASGTATPAGVRRAVDIGLVQQLLDRAQGSTRYGTVVTLRGKRVDLRIDSDLAGWQIDMPAPLAKTGGEPLPLRVELVPGDSSPERDSLRVTVGSLLAVQLERMRSGTTMRVERGVIGLGERAPLPASGVLAHIAVPRLDADRWLALLDAGGVTGSGGEVSGGNTGAQPDFLNARVQQLTIAGKAIANVVLGATRAADGSWIMNVESDHVSGALNIRTHQASAIGGPRITARLARLAIPDTQRENVTAVLDAPVTEVPGLDVIAERFELGGKVLGRLELQAANVGRGQSAAWQLQKLEISNADARMSASGQWAREPGGSAYSVARRMNLALAIDFSNAGALLTRLGIPEAVRAGAGKLEGEVDWRGSPFALDFNSLNGQLRLSAAKGQFLKASTGAGRLLGVMSLQSLPRRITLDFRDVFSEGFAFDNISANATLEDGVLDTRDFKMRGVSATVLLEGTADLRNETQALHVLVLPEINAGSASLAYALLANPAIGIGTFVAQLLLRDPLSKAFSFEYDVTGTWSDPQVRRREQPAPATSVQTP